MQEVAAPGPVRLLVDGGYTDILIRVHPALQPRPDTLQTLKVSNISDYILSGAIRLTFLSLMSEQILEFGTIICGVIVVLFCFVL